MISDKVLVRVCKYTDDEVTEALDKWDSQKPLKPIREELGGDYFYKCGWLSCQADIKSGYEYCPQCGNRIDWSAYYQIWRTSRKSGFKNIRK